MEVMMKSKRKSGGGCKGGLNHQVIFLVLKNKLWLLKDDIPKKEYARRMMLGML